MTNREIDAEADRIARQALGEAELAAVRDPSAWSRHRDGVRYPVRVLAAMKGRHIHRKPQRAAGN